MVGTLANVDTLMATRCHKGDQVEQHRQYGPNVLHDWPVIGMRELPSLQTHYLPRIFV